MARHRLMAERAAALPAQRLSKNRTKNVPGEERRARPNVRGRAVLDVSAYRGPSADEPFLDVLLVGEGNFSFARALVEALGSGARVWATGLDDAATLAAKYPEALAEHVAVLRQLGAHVVHGVDATQPGKAARALQARVFDRVAFHFPHAGRGIKDEELNIEANQNLVLGFLQTAARELLAPGGLVHVTLRTGKPYDQWNVPSLARTIGLRVRSVATFDPRQWPAYRHRRTIGFREGVSAADNEDIARSRCITYILCKRDDPKPAAS